jgi:phage major head subunit gpT-like protein
MLTSAQWAEALAPGIREWFYVGYNSRPSMMAQLFNVQTSLSAQEFFNSFGAVSPDAWGLYEKTGRVPKVSFDKGYQSTFTHQEYTLEMDVQRKFIDDNKYAQILDSAKQLGSSAALKREMDAASVFNNADAATPIGGDGVSLANANHPASPTKSTVVQDNISALALTATDVETVRQTMLSVTDDTNNVAGSQPSLLLVPTALENAAKIITQTEGAIGVADNDINPLKGQFRYLVWPYLTSATAWFMIDEVMMRSSLFWFDRSPVDIHRKQQDETLFSTWIGYMRYSFGWRDWRWIHQGNA